MIATPGVEVGEGNFRACSRSFTCLPGDRIRVIDVSYCAKQLAPVNHDTVPGDSKMIALPLYWSEITNVEWKTAIPYRMRRFYDSL